MTAALRRTGARRLIVLGDLPHSRAGRCPRLFASVANWRRGCPDTEIPLVRGNHDRSSGDPPANWDIECMDHAAPESPFVFAHHPCQSSVGYVLSGHLHPAVWLSGAGRQRQRLPCFAFGARTGVLPAFGSFTGAAVLVPQPRDRICVIADNEVLMMDARCKAHTVG